MRNPFGNLNLSKSSDLENVADDALRFQEKKRKFIDMAKRQLQQEQEHKINNMTAKEVVSYPKRWHSNVGHINIPLKISAADVEGRRAKLAPRKIGPFQILKSTRMSRNWIYLKPCGEWDLRLMWMCLVILLPIRLNSIWNHSQVARVIVDDQTGEELYVVERLLNKKKVRNRWTGLSGAWDFPTTNHPGKMRRTSSTYPILECPHRWIQSRSTRIRSGRM